MSLSPSGLGTPSCGYAWFCNISSPLSNVWFTPKNKTCTQTKYEVCMLFAYGFPPTTIHLVALGIKMNVNI